MELDAQQLGEFFTFGHVKAFLDLEIAWSAPA